MVRINRPIAISAVSALFVIALSALAVPASASPQTTPPWEPDPNALGTLTFYNTSGQVVTSGTNLEHLFDYAEASTTDPFNGTIADLGFAQPLPSTPTGSFPASPLSAATKFPNSTYPPPLNTATDPVVFLTPAEANLENFIATQTPQTAAGYANMWQVRLYTSGPGGVGTANNGGGYWDADVLVDPTTGTWTEAYPVTGTTAATTTTVLTASPQSSAQQGASVTLTATITASNSTTPAGTVEFEQDGFDLGTSTANSSGVATLTTSTLLPSAPDGTTLSAVFTPTNTSSYQSSTGTLAYTVDPVANVPTISGPGQAGQKETCSDGTLDFGVTPSYTWLANGKSIGTSSSLVVPGSAYKESLTCQVTVHDGSGPASAPATSAAVTVSLGKALTPVKGKGPSLSGPHAVGKTETVKPGTWSEPGVTFTYQWLLNGKVIKGATKSSLKLSKADNGKKLSCRVTAHATGFANGVATTASVKVS